MVEQLISFSRENIKISNSFSVYKYLQVQEFKLIPQSLKYNQTNQRYHAPVA